MEMSLSCAFWMFFFKVVFPREALFRIRNDKCVKYVIHTSSAAHLLDCLTTCLDRWTCKSVSYDAANQECLIADSFYMNNSCHTFELTTYGNYGNSNNNENC